MAAVDRGRYRCWIGEREVTAMKARELGRGGIVVGDMVNLAGDVSGQPGTLARVVRVQPRSTALRRSADDTDPIERVRKVHDSMMSSKELCNAIPAETLTDFAQFPSPAIFTRPRAMRPSASG